jgi:hypothetical protein
MTFALVLGLCHLVSTLCVLKEIICIGRKASSGLGYNAGHCNPIVLVAGVMIIACICFIGHRLIHMQYLI